MRHFKGMDLFYRLLPFPSWKDALLRGHIERCPECERCLASREEARRILVQVRDVGDLDRLWPAISDRIHGIRPLLEPDLGLEREAAPTLKGGWRLAAAAAGMSLAVVLTLALVNFFRSPSISGGGIAQGETDQVQIHYVRIDNEPARTFIFKPHDSDVVIVWAGKNI
ncbi:MAG: hypothetical protein NTU60_06850 [Candidatus Aminicenantes bacterium]|nr:hypothetical protein [Candidatus Aminicenantes bacterium]